MVPHKILFLYSLIKRNIVRFGLYVYCTKITKLPLNQLIGVKLTTKWLDAAIYYPEFWHYGVKLTC
ncbi:MAG: hypothetical protein IPI59_02230 [Sphingobacteriales bacterium]|nr:hypothetical protein [Sphingobacteriales bacterium]MBK7526383.1 hypothetical protein [Sphingobacteriales bacterium]MBK8680062.1 hypothetical protein [Sphingobacteriales bacterium]MBL0247602.1 hypothetical protein [Sphingobacteriales bacterium]